MNRFTGNRSARISAPAAIVLAAGLAAPASGVDKSWMCASGDWSNVGCWSAPLGVPGQADVVRVGNSANAENAILHLDVMNEIISGLHITDGMTVDTDNFTMRVNGNTTISGRNIVNSLHYPSRLRVDPFGDGAEFRTVNLTVSNDAVVQLEGGGILVTDLFSLGAGCELRGHGTVEFSDGGTTFVNNGEIHPTSINITLRQNGAGLYDLDGTSGDGWINLDSASSTRLNIYGSSLTDPFSGVATLVGGVVLDMELTNGWAVDAPSQFNIYGGTSASVIMGSALTFGGTFNLYGQSYLRIPAAIQFEPGSQMVLGQQAFAEFDGPAVINGGLFTLFNQADIDFDGPTEVNGGHFITFSESASQGAIDFSGPTEWGGTVTVDGIARQFGAARVTDTTVINIGTLDMDGNGSTTWTVDESLVINANQIDAGSNDFSGTLNLGGGLFGRIAVNLTDPTEAWIVSGTMNMAGNSLLYNTRVGNGSPLIVTGDINVIGKVDIATPTTLQNSASVSIPAANAGLRFMSSAVIPAGVSLSGDGVIQTGNNADLTLEDGLVFGNLGLVSSGTLRIGAGPGIVSVDRFQNSGDWAVQIGGYAAGSEFDRLIVASDGATVGGDIVVEHIDIDGDGEVFRPVVGDTFTILTAVGGVTGAFAPNITSDVNGYTYHWSAVVNANDVVLRLDSIDPPPCLADFNGDGVVNSQDFFDFLGSFFAAQASADVNADGVVNSQDFFDFLTMFFTGCE